MRTYRSVELRHACPLEKMEPATAPVKTATAPVKTTTAPVKTTTAPVKTTTAPVKTVADPTSSQAVQAAIHAAKQQKRRPKSLCSVGNGVTSPKRDTSSSSLGGLLDLLKQRSGRKCQSSGGLCVQEHPPYNGTNTSRPLSMSVLDLNRLSGAIGASSSGREFSHSSRFLRGASMFSSQRWNVFSSKTSEQQPKKNLSSLRKSFSFRLRRGAEFRREDECGDTCSLHTMASRKELFISEAPLGESKESRPSLWRLLTGPFRKKEYATGGTWHKDNCIRGAEPMLVGISCTAGKTGILQGVSGTCDLCLCLA
ncbi:uncharacterized protein LOC135032964 [Pseudophryne corroboree]|uniref:uncharacterized protein LOC135032964 n=1 Tax=Pseudophryne corroboree TaxID=495146 RepID=UPI003081B3F1